MTPVENISSFGHSDCSGYIKTAILHTFTQSLLKGQDIHPYNTRNTFNYVVSYHKTALFENEDSYIGQTLMKSLSMLRGMKSVKKKKNT